MKLQVDRKCDSKSQLSPIIFITACISAQKRNKQE